MLIHAKLEKKIRFPIPAPACLLLSYTQFLGASKVRSEAPQVRKHPCGPGGGVSLSRRSTEQGCQEIWQGHPTANLQPCPASAKAAHHSPLPNIYDEAAWGILSLGMHLGLCSGKQVGFASQNHFEVSFSPRSLLLCIKQRDTGIQLVALFKMDSLLISHNSVC